MAKYEQDAPYSRAALKEAFPNGMTAEQVNAIKKLCTTMSQLRSANHIERSVMLVFNDCKWESRQGTKRDGVTKFTYHDCVEGNGGYICKPEDPPEGFQQEVGAMPTEAEQNVNILDECKAYPSIGSKAEPMYCEECNGTGVSNGRCKSCGGGGIKR